MRKINKTKASMPGGSSYDTPYSNVKTGGSDSDRGYVAGGLDIVKAIPGKGRKGGTSKMKKTRRAY